MSLDKGLASVKMKPGNRTTLKQLQDAITKNGFTMKQSAASVAGTVGVANGKTALQVSGSNDVIELIPDSPSAPVAAAMNGILVVVEGIIPEAAKGKGPDSIRYRAILKEGAK